MDNAVVLQERIDKAIESMHTQMLLKANESDDSTVSLVKVFKYFKHLENILNGIPEENL